MMWMGEWIKSLRKEIAFHLHIFLVVIFHFVLVDFIRQLFKYLICAEVKVDAHHIEYQTPHLVNHLRW